MSSDANDHGGNIARAMAQYGGQPGQWLDLSTGINPHPYRVGLGDMRDWTSLPDPQAGEALEDAARRFWSVPDSAAVLAGSGASSLIARLPALVPAGRVDIPGPTYNEHATAFRLHGWEVVADPGPDVAARVVVHPNNPDGRFWTEGAVSGAPLAVIDESFCDTAPARSLIRLAGRPGRIVLKSFGKFWGLGGLRLGFAIGAPDLIARLRQLLGPWPVSGPALAIGRRALSDQAWAAETRARLDEDAARLDRLMTGAGARVEGGTSLFRLYRVRDANALHVQLARRHILTRIFPYSDDWIRLGLPGPPPAWARLEAAL